MSNIHLWTKMREKTGLTRIGEAWTSEEETQILSKLAQQISLQDIANDHGRTIGSIKSRLKSIAVEMVEKQIPFEQIQTITSITQKEIEDYLEKKKTYQEKKEPAKETHSHETITKSDFMEMKCLLYEIKDLLKIISQK
jgi:hypothetical protein